MHKKEEACVSRVHRKCLSWKLSKTISPEIAQGLRSKEAGQGQREESKVHFLEFNKYKIFGLKFF